jgi:peptide/nickel transport system permease protein
LISIVVLAGISLMLYAMVRSMPADYVSLSTVSIQKITQEQKDNLRRIYGLDKSIPEGYADWLKNVLHGDLGTSLVFARPVTEIIKKYLPVTFMIAALALIFQLLFGIPLGILAAQRRGTKTDHTIAVFVFIGISVPSFFLAAILRRTFGYYGLNLLPTAGMLNPRVIYNGFSFAQLTDYIRHLIIPILVFIIVGTGGWLRYTRTNMIDALNSDYVRTARAKGIPEKHVVYNHALRNTLIPTVTLLGAQLPGLFSGAIITENIFAIQGLGNIAFTAANMSDVPYLMGFNMFLALCTVLGYFTSDILYAVVDPRIRLS